MLAGPQRTVLNSSHVCPNTAIPKAVYVESVGVCVCVCGCHFLSVSTQRTLTPPIRFLCLVNVLRIPNIEDFILLFVVSLLMHSCTHINK